jgi:hypothetical protein
MLHHSVFTQICGGILRVALNRNTVLYNREFLFVNFHGPYLRVALYRGGGCYIGV